MEMYETNRVEAAVHHRRSWTCYWLAFIAAIAIGFAAISCADDADSGHIAVMAASLDASGDAPPEGVPLYTIKCTYTTTATVARDWEIKDIAKVSEAGSGDDEQWRCQAEMACVTKRKNEHHDGSKTCPTGWHKTKTCYFKVGTDQYEANAPSSCPATRDWVATGTPVFSFQPTAAQCLAALDYSAEQVCQGLIGGVTTVSWELSCVCKENDGTGSGA